MPTPTQLSMIPLTITILGSGTSMGVPMAGCDCRVCRSPNPRDKRLRTSVHIAAGDRQLLIDTSADYRQQMLRAGITHLDAVLYTHHHVDHILGMDDLRSFNIRNRTTIPIYGREETLANIQRVFTYAFPEDEDRWRLPKLSVHPITSDPFRAAGVPVTPVELMHGRMPVLGFRIGDFAYCTDVNHIPDHSYARLRNLDVLILDALRYDTHPSHFSIDEAVAEARRIGARRTYLTHLSHAVMHDEGEAALPEGVHLAYDGLRFELTLPDGAIAPTPVPA